MRRGLGTDNEDEQYLEVWPSLPHTQDVVSKWLLNDPLVIYSAGCLL